jgi:hypothetical protein
MEMRRLGRLVTRPAADVLRDAKHDPTGHVTLAWLGDVALYLQAQWALQAGEAGIEEAQRELLGQVSASSND